ncbi:MAG TPA: hypothetical protein VEX86_10235 [Longimicrobium sp.]|nr:hypothetical protein [Longimicrobium sp.]
MPTRVPFRRLAVSGVAWGAVALLVLIGVAAAFVADHERLWLAVHFNWLFWSSMAVGMVVFAISQHITNARWSWPLRRFALAGVAFLPISFVLFLLKLPGRPVWFEHWWGPDKIRGDHVLEAKAGWLQPTGMLVRDVVGLLVLFGMMLWFAYHMLRPDLHGVKNAPGLYHAISGKGWRGVPEEAMRSRKIAMRLAPITALLFAFVWGMIAIDEAMTMLPHWFSTMFPVTFLVSAFHSGLAMVAILLVLGRRQLRLQDYVGMQQFHDLGKLIFAYAVFWMYVNWSQYVVIWYGLLPHEQEWFVQRFKAPFAPVVQVMLACVFVFPFLALLPRAPKKVSGVLAGVSAVVVLGHWLERFLITYPSVWNSQAHPHLPLGIPEIGIALGFAGLFFGSVAWFLSTFPVLMSPASLATIPTPTIEVPLRRAPAARV